MYKLYLFIGLLTLINALPIINPDNDDHEDNPVMLMTETPEESFMRSDINGDLSLNFDEFLHTELSYIQLKKGEFDMLDMNGDGLISQNEYSSFYQQKTKDSDETSKKYFISLFKEFDKNSDKRLNQSEIKRILSKRFYLSPKDNFSELYKRYDTDNDGGLDLNEYQQFDKTFPFEELEPIRVVV